MVGLLFFQLLVLQLWFHWNCFISDHKLLNRNRKKKETFWSQRLGRPLWQCLRFDYCEPDLELSGIFCCEFFVATLAREYQLNARDGRVHVPQTIRTSLRYKAVAGIFYFVWQERRERLEYHPPPTKSRVSQCCVSLTSRVFKDLKIERLHFNDMFSLSSTGVPAPQIWRHWLLKKIASGKSHYTYPTVKRN